MKSYEALIEEAERDRAFATRLNESARKVVSFKKKSTFLARTVARPTVARMAGISRRLWEFSEQVRLETLNRQESA